MIPINGFHVEPTNICTLKCSGCARTRFIDQWPQHWKNHNLDIDVFLKFLDIDITDLKINFCGNYGDPIYHPRFIEMIRKVKDRGAIVSITTNGSYRNAIWWENLCATLHLDDKVQFSIDGVPENFTNYRENADWTSIRKGLEICTTHGIKTVWKFIPFSFNQDSIDQARSIAHELGADFCLDPSDRFDDLTQRLIPAKQFVANRQNLREQKTGLVDAKCFRGQEHFITATGHYSPCCFVADHRFYYKTTFGKDKKLFDIRNIAFSKLMEHSSMLSFVSEIGASPPSVCQFNCPKSS